METPIATNGEQDTAPVMSLGARLTNVFVAPGEVFEQVRHESPCALNWLVPILLSCVAGILFTVVVFSQPAVLQKLQEQQDQRLQQMVADGKITTSQADTASERIEQLNGPTIYKIIGSISVVMISFVWLFAVGLVLWQVGTRGFRGQFTYRQTLEMIGLSSMVTILGSIFTMFLVVAKGNLLITLGPALLLQELNPQNKAHLVLSSLNVITLWYVSLLAIGLAKLSGTTLLKAALVLCGLWAGLRLTIIYSGLAASGM